MAANWYDIKFLESASNLRDVLKRSFGRMPNATAARDISVAIQQGRLFFEQAQDSPIEIRPLLVYYGVLSFARAVTAAINGVRLNDLKRAHGLKDFGTPTQIDKLSLQLDGIGTFQEFNDAIAPLAQLEVRITNGGIWKTKKAFDLAGAMDNKTIALPDVLSRIPEISYKYHKHYGSPPKCLYTQIIHMQNNRWIIRLEDPFGMTDRESLRSIVTTLRDKYNFLKDWRLYSANLNGANTVIIFDNRSANVIDDLSETELKYEGENSFCTDIDNFGVGEGFRETKDILPALSGTYGDNVYNFAIQPLNGARLNEYSLYFLGTFLLSSLVRYRPQIWQHALSKSVTAESPADDRLLSLIEHFIDTALTEFPRFVVNILSTKHSE